MIALLLAIISIHTPAVCPEDSWCWNALTQGNHQGRWYMVAPDA